MQVQDVAKLCYQATFGAEHLLINITTAKNFLLREFAQTPAREEPLCENISDEYCRVNLGAWKWHGYPIDELFSLFLQTAQTKSNATAAELEEKLQAVSIFCKYGTLPFSPEAWQSFLSQYDRQPLHHSEVYRQSQKPAYRVISRHLLNVSALYR